MHPYGKPVNVLGFTENDKVFIHDEPLRQMFLHPDVKDRKIVAFSIIGAYRKGKSFFLDYCLRYLYAHYSSINYQKNPISNPDDWIGDKDEPLEGFSWRSGSDRDTTGIVMWNDVFLHTDEISGQEIAIIVMDTQGLFDNQSSPIDNSKIFALETLISSIQVFNISGVVQEEQLQYLQFATEFAKYAASSSQGMNTKCFQNLMFLIRDWVNPDDFAYGIDGGKNYLNFFLEVRSEQKAELKYVREFIRNSFEELSCSLLPHPGKIVTRAKKYNNQLFDGSHKGMDEDFRDELTILIDHLLKPERLVLKKFNGCNVKGFEYHEYVEHYFKLFQLDKLPQAQTIFDATVEMQLTLLIDSCVDIYKKTLVNNLELIKGKNIFIILQELSKSKALLAYHESKKMGNIGHEAKFKKKLEMKIDKFYENWKLGGTTIEEDHYREFIELLEKEEENQLKPKKDVPKNLFELMSEHKNFVDRQKRDIVKYQNQNYNADTYKIEKLKINERIQTLQEQNKKLQIEMEMMKMKIDSTSEERNRKEEPTCSIS